MTKVDPRKLEILRSSKAGRRGDGVRWRPVAIVDKFDSDGNHYERIVAEGNEVTTAGFERLTSILTGNSEPITDDTVRLGVGSSDDPFEPEDESLGEDEFYQVMEDGFPATVEGRMTFRVIFGSDDANFVWNSWGLDVATSTGVTSSASPEGDLLNRKVFSFGEKSGGDWMLTVHIDLLQE